MEFKIGDRVVLAEPARYRGDVFPHPEVGQHGRITYFHRGNAEVVIDDQGSYLIDLGCLEPEEIDPDIIKATIESIKRAAS